MNLISFNNNNTTPQNKIYNRTQNTPIKFGLRMSAPLRADTVSFLGRNEKLSAKEKMNVYSNRLLDEINLKEDQPLYIKADSKYLPFLNSISAEAYKRGSGKVKLEVVEPEIEQLKKKYNITEEFDYKKEERQEFEDDNAIFLTLNDKNNPYKQAGLSDKEIKSELKEFNPEIPQKVRDEYKFSPEEICNTALDLHKGEPVAIFAEREHLPYVVKLVDYLYSKNNTKLVDVTLNDKSSKNLLKYGKEELLDKVPQSSINELKEKHLKDTARLYLEGADPNELEGVDSKRIVKRSQAFSKARREYSNKMLNNNPWLIYYAPTTKSAAPTYPEYKDDSIKALSYAFKDANKINRVGKLNEHVEELEYRAKKMNNLLDNGYRTIHYVSVNPETKQPDGKTDFTIDLSEKSKFNAAREDMKKTGHRPLVNIPTEEVFTSPLNNSAEGHIAATMPLTLNGKIVEGIEMTFHKGKITDVTATKNEEMLKEHIKANKNADRLGEVALVAGSPIAKTGRLFNNTLLDENAACHLALGDAFAECIKGAGDIEDYNEQKEFLKNEHINSSTTHNDFMVGGPNVYISAVNKKTGDSIDIIKDDKFLL